MLLSMCEIPFDLARVVFAALGDGANQRGSAATGLMETWWRWHSFLEREIGASMKIYAP